MLRVMGKSMGFFRTVTSENSPSSLSAEKWQFLRAIRRTEVDRPDAPEIYSSFVSYLDEHCANPAHYLRYCQTFLAMTPYLTGTSNRKLLETGGLCDITRFLRTRGYECRGSKSDLRYKIDAEDRSADIILSLEVIEHIKDRTEARFEDVVLFRGTGVATYAEEIDRVLAPEGLLVLTTPNPCSARALELLIANEPPMVFRSHEREYSRAELIKIFGKLQLLEAKTHWSFFNLGPQARQKWQSVFERNGWDANDRGDDHFMAFRKSNGATQKH